MTENKPELPILSPKKNIFAVIGIIVFVVIVVWLVRKPSIPSTQPAENQTQENNKRNIPMMDEAKRLEAVVNSYPDSIEAVLSLAHFYQDVGVPQKAIPAYAKYLAKDPKNADARIDMGISYFQLSFGDTLEKASLLSKAVTEMELALKYSPAHLLGHFNLGIIYLQSGNINEAVKYFKKCISLNPKSPLALKAKEILDQHIQNQSNNTRKD